MYPMGNVQVIVAASQFLTRLGIKTLLSVIGVESDYIELKKLDKISHHVQAGGRSYLIVEQSLLGTPATGFLKQVSQKYPGCKIMVVGDTVIENCPCSHFVLNGDSQQVILEKFQDFFNENETPSKKAAEQNTLSDRETEVLKEVARGLANKEIADKLYISINTVITHRKNITEKLGVKTVSALTVYALMNNLIAPEEAIK
jgi:DNA-binding CsgD family transcriptional regulator